MKQKRINLALVCTMGGHFEQMTNLVEFYEKYDHFWVTNKNKQTLSHLKNEGKYFVRTAHYKKPWTYLLQLFSIIRIFVKEKPTHLLSTGSGRTAFIPFLLARLLRIKFIYIDTFSRVNGYSKFGTFLLKIRYPIFSQWHDYKCTKVNCIGPIFKKVDNFIKEPKLDYIFVTLGTREEPFTRLIKAVEDLVKKGAIKEKVIVQAGTTKYSSDILEIFDFCTPERIDELIKNSKYIITQESAGIGTKCLKYNTKFFVMPRDYKFGELPSKSDMNEDLHIKLSEIGYTRVVNDFVELKEAIDDLNRLKVGFNFNNELAIETLTKVMEEA